MRWIVTQRSLIVLLGVCLGALVGAFTLPEANAAPANDSFANATLLTGITTNFVTSNNAGATAEPGEPSHADAAGSNSVWWSWQAPSTGSFGISTRGSTFDTLLAVYTGDSISNLQAVADNDDDVTGGFGVVISSVVFRALAGETYRIAVDGFSGATGTVRLAIGRVGYPAPFWSLADLNSNVVNSTDFRPRVLVIDFWETICGACVDELPDLVRLQRDLSSEGFTLFGVSKDDKMADVRGFVRSNNIPYGIAMRTAEMEGSFGGNVALPTKFVIDRENNIVGTYIGGVAGTFASNGVTYAFYEKVLKPLLRGAKEVHLQVRQQTDSLVLAWPATEFGYNLESTTALGGSNWTVVSSQVTVTNDQKTITIPAGPDTKFFRLRKTPAY